MTSTSVYFITALALAGYFIFPASGYGIRLAVVSLIITFHNLISKYSTF